MPAPYPSRPPRFQPVGPQMVSRRDPTAAGIVACYQPSNWNGYRNLAGLGCDLVPLASGAIVGSAVGRSLSTIGVNPGAAATIGTSSPLSIIGSISLMWYGVFIGDQTGTNPSLIDLTANNSDASPFIANGLERVGGTPASLYFSYATAGAANAQLEWATAVDTTKYGQPLLLLLSATAGGAVNLYVNGVDQGAGTLLTGSAFDGNTTYTSTSQVCLGSYPAVASRFFNGYSALAGIWNRPVTPNEANLLFADPYRILAPRFPARPVMPQPIQEWTFQTLAPAY